MSTTRFCTDYAKRVAKCQKCKMQLEKGILRMGKIVPNFFIQKDDGKPPPDMKQYFHKNCLFEMLFKARPTTKVIESIEEIEGFDVLNGEDQEEIRKLVEELSEKRKRDGGGESKTPKKTPAKKKEKEEPKSSKRKGESSEKRKKSVEIDENSGFNRFSKFCKVCEIISNCSEKDEKSAIITSLVNKEGFNGDLVIWLNLLLPKIDRRDFEVSEKDLMKYFSRILNEKLELKENENVERTIRNAVEKIGVNEKSDWNIQKINRFLEKLAELKTDEEKASHLKFAAKRLSPLELEYLLRIVMKDLKIGAKKDVILAGIHPNALESFKIDKDLKKLVEKFNSGALNESKKPAIKRRKVESGEESENEVSESEEGSLSESDESDDESISESSESEVSSISSGSSAEEDDELKENKPKVTLGTRSRPRNAQNQIEKCPDGMEPCRYGAKCYRKNKEHKEEFWHPTTK